MGDINMGESLPYDGFVNESSQTISFDHSAQPKPENPSRLQQARQAQEERREIKQALAVADNNGQPALVGIERCNEIDVQLPDGRIVSMARPKFASKIKAELILKDQKFADPNILAMVVSEIQAVLHIVSIDGESVEPPANWVQYLSLTQKLGDAGLDVISYAFLQCFPGTQANEFKIIKKS